MTPVLPVAVLAVLIATGAAGAAGPAAPSIVGQWQQDDDDTHAPDAVIEIREAAGVYTGTIVKLFPAPDRPTAPRCTACGGARKNQPIVGLTVIEDVRRSGAAYDGGSILDPDSGKSYSVMLKPAADGRTLEVTGYVGLPALGERRVWRRIP
jgi:uncharacterized protein (DUF2147 family)